MCCQMKPRSLNKILEMNEKRNSKQYYWKDGYSKDTRGYISIYYPEHPFNKGRKTKSIRRSRLIMEEYLERYLTTYEYVHHDNEIITDDRIENLKLMTPAEHQRIHHIGKKASDDITPPSALPSDFLFAIIEASTLDICPTPRP